MSPSSTKAEPTVIRKAVPRSLLIRLFVDHPVAKLISITLAILVILTIERELDAELLNTLMTVREGDSAGVSGRDLLLIRHDPDFEVIVETERVQVIVNGLGKLREILGRPARAYAEIPRARLLGIPKDEWLTLQVEPSDVTFPGLSGIKVKLGSPVEIRAAWRTKVSKRLVAKAIDVPEGKQVAAITFLPQNALIAGPAPDLLRTNEVTVVVPADSAGTHRVTELVEKRLAFADGQVVRAVVELKAEEDICSLTRVRLDFNVPQSLEYDITLPETSPAREGMLVRVRGPKALVEQFNADPERLHAFARESAATVLVSDAIADMTDVPPEGKEVSAHVNVIKLPQILIDQGFRAMPDHEVQIRVTPKK